MPEIQKFTEKVTDSQISGFYYDEQLKNKYLRVSLHPNTELKGDEWVEVSGETLRPMSTSTWSGLYRKEPIAVSLLTEDFQVEINNSWTDFDSGNPIESLWNSAKPYAPMLKRLGTGLKEATKSMGGTKLGSTVADFLNTGAETIGDLADIGSKYLNKALIVQGTRFSYYAGTSTTFGNLAMKYTIFSDWDENGEFITVNDQLNKIYPYSMGTYDKYTGQIFGGGTADKILGEYIGVQNPPGGFEADTKSVDNCQKGTLRLVIGGYYSIENLIVRNVSFVMSKAMAKHPKVAGELTPLYADVTITLAPASMYTDKALMRFTNNAGMEDIIKEQREINIKLLEKEMKANGPSGGSISSQISTPSLPTRL